MYNLLTTRQRMEVAFENLGQKAGKRERKGSALLSREWLTTVPSAHDGTGDQNFPIVLRRLPFSDKNPDALAESISKLHELDRVDLGHIKDLINDKFKNSGVTTSGSWYLGTMSGGNRELATDIIRELVSGYHETDRVLSGCGAPVSLQSYREDCWTTCLEPEQGNSGASCIARLPYADLISALIGTPSDPTENPFLLNHIFFPFSRTRIRSYTMIALVLASLIRNTMRLPVGAVPFPLPEPEVANTGSSLDRFIDNALARIDDIHKNSLQR
jgi:hypothetical protein